MTRFEKQRKLGEDPFIPDLFLLVCQSSSTTKHSKPSLFTHSIENIQQTEHFRVKNLILQLFQTFHTNIRAT